MRSSQIFAAIVAIVALSSSALAQAINLDIGKGNGQPAPVYGAAAGQAGVWNKMTVTAGGPLVDLNGSATGASVSSLVQHTFSFTYNNPFTTGDDEQLLDAGHDGAMTLDFVGLQNGDYFVYTYAFAPDNPVSYITQVSVMQSTDPIQLVGGTEWSGTHAAGVSYAKHRVSVRSGSLRIICTVGSLYATVNGVQLEPIPDLPLVYCTPKTNSLGCVPSIAFAGTPSASAGSGFFLVTTDVINNTPGLYMYTVNGPSFAPFTGGIRCVNAPVRRSIGLNASGSATGSDCTGVLSIDMNAFAVGGLGGSPAVFLLLAGTVIDAQMWGRDNGFAAPNNTTLSAGVHYTIGP